MEFKSGLARIAERLPEAAVIPVAIRYEFLKNKRAGLPGENRRAGRTNRGRCIPSSHAGSNKGWKDELAALDTEIAQELALQP